MPVGGSVCSLSDDYIGVYPWLKPRPFPKLLRGINPRRIQKVTVGRYDAKMARPRTKTRMSAEDRLTLVRAKVERAKQNFMEMEFIIHSAHGYIPGVNMHVKSRKRLPGQLPTYEIPFDALTATGDVVHNLRGALDHLAYQLTKANRPRTTDEEFRNIYFPISKDETAYKKAAKGYEKFFGTDAVKLIDSLKPYKGGNEALYRLHYLNNLSKHRLLLTMERHVVCRATWVNGSYMYKFGRPQFSGIYARPKVNDYILLGGKETLSKLRSGRREALLPTLRYLIDTVDSLIDEFLPFLE
jgi:hypothetical protein